MEWILTLGVLVFIIYRATKSKKNRILRENDIEVLRVHAVSNRVQPECTVEIINSDGIPEFKYRFIASLDFFSPSEALRKHRQEKFIARPNGNRDFIQEQGGYWMPVSEWERSETTSRHEEEPFKYIGGSKVYIALLLAVRAVYEDKAGLPQEKREAIEKICLDNENVYTVKYLYAPPWEALLVPALSLGEGIGPHRVKILEEAGVKSIHHVRSRTDAELLDIKGIGKVAVAALRNLSNRWVWDEQTEVIEKDEEYRKICSSIANWKNAHF